MPGYVVFSPYDGAPVPAANEQVRDELVNVFGYHLDPPELDDEASDQEPAQPAADVGGPADAAPAEDQALEEHGDEAGEEPGSPQ